MKRIKLAPQENFLCETSHSSVWDLEGHQLIHFIFIQLKICNLEVFSNSPRIRRFGNDGDSALNGEANENWAGRLGVALCQGKDCTILQQIRNRLAFEHV